ncbi:hypothetical protein J3F83DRAFT_749381 [Trichoderma novae-zelandiae]
MEDPGASTASSRCRDHSDEAIIPFGVPSCPLVSRPPASRTPTLLYANRWRHCTRYTNARGCSVPLDAANCCPATSRIYSGRTCTACCRARQPPAFPETLAVPSAISSPERRSQCLGRCRARMRGRSYPWISCSGRGSTTRNELPSPSQHADEAKRVHPLRLFLPWPGGWQSWLRTEPCMPFRSSVPKS